MLSPLHHSGKIYSSKYEPSSQLNCSDICFNCSDAVFNCSDAWLTARMLVSIAQLPVKLVESMSLVISSKLDNSDKLKMALLKGYKVLRDLLWGIYPRYPQDKT